MYVCIFLLSFSCSNDEVKTLNESSFYKPPGVITQEHATELSKAWSAKNSALFSKGANAKLGEEVKYLRWSLEDLRNYLDYAENEAKTKGYNMTGVRVYFAAYPEKGGQNTMFFAPAGYKSVSQANMFSTLLVGAEGNIPVPPLNNGTGGDGTYP